MAKILVEIPDNWYEQLQNNIVMARKFYTSENYEKLILGGTPLPKGHGRIADVDKMLDEMRATRTYDILFALERIKPIIEADKER